MTKNEIQQLMKDNNVKQWQVADKLKMTEQALSKLFRYELKQIDVDRIVKAINDIKKAV